MSTVQETQTFAYKQVIAEICGFAWNRLSEEEFLDAAWGYYFFSVQFRENLRVARHLFSDDARLTRLEKEECNTDNLSPWPGVAMEGERLDHDEFMRRLLALASISDARRFRFRNLGERYLSEVRSIDPLARAMSIASYEDGGLERVFTAMLKAPNSDNLWLCAFRHFLSEHIRFDSDPDQGHGSLSRYIQPDDRVLPLWVAFKHLLVEFTPRLARGTDEAT